MQLSDGTVAYISNQYLSTTKPVVQQQQPQPSGGQSREDKNKADNEAAGQGLAGMDAWATEHNTGENHPELRPGAIVDENGNITNPNTAVNAQ